jgi:hypothetical protein
MLLFEWDDVKARLNLRKHGIDFENAASVFDDPHRVTEQDRVVDGEARWQTIGVMHRERIVLVAHLTRDESGDEVVRIISARKATRRERVRYEQNRAQNSF